MQGNPSALARELAGVITADPDALGILRDALHSPTPEPWVGVEKVAEHLDCEPQRIYNLKSEGRIPYHKDGSRLLFRLSEIDTWLRQDQAERSN